MADERRLAQIDGREQALHPIDVTLVRVVLTLHRLVRAAEADEIGRDRAESCGGEDRDHLAIQVRPRRLAVEAEDRRCRRRSLVDVVDAETADLRVVRLEGISREIGEPRIGRAKIFHVFSD